MRLRWNFLLFFIVLLAFVPWGQLRAQTDQAVYFDIENVSWDQRCLLETLQGLVNRNGPRLFINSPAWDMPWDHQWVDIYHERNNIGFRRDIQDISSLIEHFNADVNGIVIYDPKVDGTRYMAMTLAGIDNLLPVSPGLLDGYVGSLKDPWTGIDFAKIDEYQLLSACGQGIPQSIWETEMKLHKGTGVVAKAILRADQKEVTLSRHASKLEYGPFLLDLSQQRFMEIATDDLKDGMWTIHLVVDNDTFIFDGGAEKIKRWDLVEKPKKKGKVNIRCIRLILNNNGGAEITWKSVRFLDREEEYIPIKKPEPLLKQVSLKVKHDLRGKFKDTLAAYNWGLENLMPRCDRGFAHTVDGVVDGMNIGGGPWRSCDFAVMKKGFIFNLSFNEKDVAAFGQTYKGVPEQAKMYRRILTSLKQPAFITGYGDSENDWFPLMNEYGHTYLVPQYCNLSFHAAVKPNKQRLQQKKHYTTDDVEVDPTKYYICFISSDGDTMKGPVSQHYQSWNKDEKRGSVPFTFAIPMCMGRYFPAMLEYYYDTATDDDYFTGCAVWKLNSTEKAAEKLYSRLAEDMRLSDYDTVCNVSLEPVETERYELFNEMLDPLGISQIIWWKGSGYGMQHYLKDGTPLITNPDWFGYCKRATLDGSWEATALDTVYKEKKLWKETVQKLVDHCELVASKHEPPFVITIFPSVHHHYTQYSICSDIAEALDTDRFKVVRFDEAMAIIKKYNQEKAQ